MMLLRSLAVLSLCAATALPAQGACAPLDSMADWARVNRAWTAPPDRWANDSLRRVLLALAERDQEARRDFGVRAIDSVYVRELNALDSVLAAEVLRVLDRFDVPTRALVGAAGADAFMLVVQHNWPLQERVLARAKALPAGSLSPQALAMLEDRVLVHQGKSQRFGTQFNLGTDGLFRFAPTEDLAGLAARRTGAGLPPLDQYVCLLEEAGMRVVRSSLPPGP